MNQARLDTGARAALPASAKRRKDRTPAGKAARAPSPPHFDALLNTPMHLSIPASTYRC